MTTSSTILTDVPTIQKPEHKVAAHIRDAAQATGVSFEYLLAQANQESRLNPNAKNGKSSAMGLFQFTSGTWMDMIKNHGADYGLGQYSDAIVKGSDGRWTVKDKALKKEILELRRDPRLSALMAAEYAKDNEQVLEAKLGRQVSTQDLYLAHFLGAGGALKVLKGRHRPDSDQQPAELARAAQANPDVFMDPASGEQRSLDSVYAAVEKRYRNALNAANRVAGQLHPQIDLAALRPAERPAEAGSDTPTVAAAALQPTPMVGAATGTALTMTDIPANVSSFPARLPPRPQPTETKAAPANQSFPVALPPPVTGARTAANSFGTNSFGTLLSANEDEG